MADQPCRVTDDAPEQLRQQALERDEHVCQRCRDREVENTLEVHRLVPLSEYDGSDPVETLVTLCCSCHAVMHPDDDSVDRAREQATLFPHTDAPEAVSRMRTPKDRVCWDCESEIEDPTNLVSYELSAEDETLILCTACEEKLYGYTGPMGLGTTEHKSDNSSDGTTETTSTETDPQSSDDLLDAPMTYIIFHIFSNGSDKMVDTQDASLRSKVICFFVGIVGVFTVSAAVLGVISEWIFPRTDYSPISIIVLTLIIFVVFAISDVNTEDAVARFGWAFLVVCSGGVTIYLGGWFVKTVLWHTVGSPIISVFETAMAIPSSTVPAILGMFGFVVVSLLYMSWRTGSAINWTLTLRMITSVFLLFGLTVVFFIAVWRLIEIAVWIPMMLLGVGSETQQLITNVVGIWLLVAFVYHELVPIIDAKPENATVIAPEKHPTIHAITNRIAAQLDIPVPTIAVTPESGAETITWGYRPGNMTLVLSQGTINMLDEEELEAVIAHELAHVANMDAIVMTIASLPVLLADGLIKRASQMIITEETVETSGGMDTAQSDTESDFSLIRGVLWVITIIPFIIVGLVVLILSLIFAISLLGRGLLVSSQP